MARHSSGYLFALPPLLVVLTIGPALAVVLPPLVALGLGPARGLGAVPLFGGVALALWAVRASVAAGASPNPASEPTRLVTTGPFAYTRNPIYLGTVVAVAGEAVLLESPLLVGYAGLLWLGYHLLTVYKEEPELRAALGKDYEAYRSQVPRWLWPVSSS